jgi:hypothetical protein
MPDTVKCPVCERATATDAFYQFPYLVPQAVELVHRIQPSWREGDGCCRRCFDSVAKTLDDAAHQEERLNSRTGIRVTDRIVGWDSRDASGRVEQTRQGPSFLMSRPWPISSDG